MTEETTALAKGLYEQLSPEEQAKVNTLNTSEKEDYYSQLSPDYKKALINQQKVTAEWGMGGDSSRALNAVSIAITAALGGQTDLQAASNALAPYAAQIIGQEFGHGEDKNTAAQLVAHALLGATLAYINGGDPTAGGSTAVASEAAAMYFTNQYKDNKEYQDAHGEFQPNLLPEDVKAQIRDLTAGIGAVIGGAVGDSSYNAQLAGVIGQNAVENNQYAQFYACNDKNQCVLVDDKPIKQFTLLEENLIRPISVLFGVVGKVNKVTNASNKDKKQEHTFPDSVWTGKAPKQVEPGTKTVTQERYNPKTNELEKSTVYYDQYGRMTKRTDYTSHGYSNKDSKTYHSNPHTHKYEYSYENRGGKETRINHD